MVEGLSKYIYMGTSYDVMISKLDYQTIVNKFTSYRKHHISRLVSEES